MSSRPAGDPNGMRHEAEALCSEAEAIRRAAGAIPDIPKWAFLGPAATRLRNRLTALRDEEVRAAGIVEAAARTLFEEARRLEEDIRRWEDEQRRLSRANPRH